MQGRAQELALKAGDEELASRVKAFQFRDIRARSASDIADLDAASSLLGHSEKVITEKIYRRIGQAVRYQICLAADQSSFVLV